MYTIFNVCIEKNEAISFILHLCSDMLLIYSNYHHNVFACTNSVFCKKQKNKKSVLISALFTSLCTLLFHPVFATFSLFLPFFTFLGRMNVYARSRSSGSGSSICIFTFTCYRLKKIYMFLFRLWNWLFWQWIMYK